MQKRSKIDHPPPFFQWKIGAHALIYLRRNQLESLIFNDRALIVIKTDF